MRNNRPKSLVRRTAWPDSASRPIGSPIQPSVVHAAESPDALDAQYEGRAAGYAYAREGHPNADLLVTKLNALEGADAGVLTGSGMAALSVAMLGRLKSGDHVLAGNQLYGRSLRLLKEELPKLGIDVTLAPSSDAAGFGEGLRETTRMILVEVVSNPTLRVADIAGIAALARAHEALLIVDNTFTTPRGFQPFPHGADLVVHSVTKLLAGHSDATLGYVGARDASLLEPIANSAITLGMTASPFDCWLAERGLFSFELRYDKAEENAAKIADTLSRTPGVKQVLYPGRDDHPDRARAKALLGDRGGTMVSFVVDGGREAANALVRAAPDIAFAPTLGDIGTTLSHPASSSHRGLTEGERAALGITEGFFRLSVGVEDADLIIGELQNAIATALGTGA